MQCPLTPKVENPGIAMRSGQSGIPGKTIKKSVSPPRETDFFIPHPQFLPPLHPTPYPLLPTPYTLLPTPYPTATLKQPSPKKTDINTIKNPKVFVEIGSKKHIF